MISNKSLKKLRTTNNRLRSDSQAFALKGMNHEQILEIMLPDLQKLAEKFYKSKPQTYLELEDLTQEASIAAYEFIIHNDLESTISFKTHLIEYAESAIANAYHLSIPITPKELEKVEEYRTFLDNFFEQHGRVPERCELIEHYRSKLGDSLFSKWELEDFKRFSRERFQEYTEGTILKYLKKIQSDSAMIKEVSIHETDPKYLVDSSKTLYEQTAQVMLMNLLWKSMQTYVEKRKGLSNLSARKTFFCALSREYYGFDLREISEMLKINHPSQVRDYEHKGVRRLRAMLEEKEVSAGFTREY